MRRLFIVAFLGVLVPGPVARAQSVPATAPLARYWVTLADKDGVAFDSHTYFSVATRARRARQHLPAADATDRPVRSDYVAGIRAAVDTVTLVSRWFNAVAVRATPAQAAALGACRVCAKLWRGRSSQPRTRWRRMPPRMPGILPPKIPTSPPTTTAWPAAKPPR